MNCAGCCFGLPSSLQGNAGMSAYSASKGAVIAYAKSVGKEHALTGITVNSLAPATIHTAMLASMDPQQVKALTDKIPMRRYCLTLYNGWCDVMYVLFSRNHILVV